MGRFEAPRRARGGGDLPEAARRCAFRCAQGLKGAGHRGDLSIGSLVGREAGGLDLQRPPRSKQLGDQASRVWAGEQRPQHLGVQDVPAVRGGDGGSAAVFDVSTPRSSSARMVRARPLG
jgi:hypothetical protein